MKRKSYKTKHWLIYVVKILIGKKLASAGLGVMYTQKWVGDRK